MDAIGVVVAGAAGRMGRMLVREVAATPGVRLHAALVREGHDWIGRDAGEAAGGDRLDVAVTTDAVEAMAGAQALIDFTTPALTRDLSELAAQARAVHVVGTTGLGDEDMAALGRAGRHAVVVQAGNMSLGVNLLVGLARKVAAALGEEFDAEIVEAHHRHKVDAPSGTALMLGRAVAEGRAQDFAAVRDPAREGITGERRAGHIGFSAIRGGDVVGEHDVIFAGPGERVILRHVATDRAIFARGAVRAALWGHGRPMGVYDMADVLGL